jgi:bacterioferritin-associated ferredoxin
MELDPAGVRNGRRPEAHLHGLAIEGDRISARLTLGDVEHVLAFHAPGVPLAERYEPFLVAALPIAMRRAASLSVPEPVSARLLGALPTIQQILSAWDSDNHVVPVNATGEVPEYDRERDTASFFTGGVDSFFTAVRNIDSIDAFVYVHGFDVPLEDLATRRRASETLRAACTELGRPLLEVEATIRHVSSDYLPWTEYQGAALASVGLLLGRRFRRILIAASHSYRDLFPWGSHPLVDPLWSTEAVEVVHEGAVDRVEKTAEISRSEVAMRYLRVCTPSASNCGRCEKCLRTMVGLQLVGGLERCETLPHLIPVRRLARVRVRVGGSRSDTRTAIAYARENLHAAEELGADAHLRRALRWMIWRGNLYLGVAPTRPGARDRVWQAVRSLRALGRRARRRVRGSKSG